jgi:hypothetical protein
LLKVVTFTAVLLAEILPAASLLLQKSIGTFAVKPVTAYEVLVTVAFKVVPCILVSCSATLSDDAFKINCSCSSSSDAVKLEGAVELLYLPVAAIRFTV